MDLLRKLYVKADGFARGQTMAEYVLIVAAVAVVVYAGYQTKMDKPVHAASVLGRKKLRDIEIFHFASDLCCHRAGIKETDFGDA